MMDRQFSYQETKSEIVMISSHGRTVTTLKGNAALKFLMKVQSLDDKGQQLLMAKATGQFKFGNEKAQKEQGPD